MSNYARVRDGVVVDVLPPHAGMTLAQMVHPDTAPLFTPCGPDVAIGWIEEGGVFSAPPPPAPLVLDLAAVKATLKAAIDAAAETERLRYITAGAGQAMEYQQAAAEAASYLASPQPDAPAGTYPMLEASLGIDGETLTEVAEVVAGMQAQWHVVGSAIRAVRLAGKAAIDAAPDAAAARAVTVTWPNPGAE